MLKVSPSVWLRKHFPLHLVTVQSEYISKRCRESPGARRRGRKGEVKKRPGIFFTSDIDCPAVIPSFSRQQASHLWGYPIMSNLRAAKFSKPSIPSQQPAPASLSPNICRACCRSTNEGPHTISLDF